jgi:hypothetical protein
MMRVVLLAVLSGALFLLQPAEVRMNLEQLRAFVSSSRKLGHSDKQIADYLKNIKLTERLDSGTVEDLGAGPKTADVLRHLVEASKSLPAAAPPPPPPVVQPIPPPDSVEQARVLDAARNYARDYSKNLPNFICTQVTRRYLDPSGLEFWQQQDVVVSKLSFFEQKENYKVVLVNNRVVDTSLERIGGVRTSGEFGSMLKELFDPATRAQFEWERWATLRGHRMHVYSYSVAQERSKYTIQYEHLQPIIPAYTGLVYVDRDTLTIMRVTQEVTQVPVGFPINYVRNILDYDNVQISGQPFILPLKASTVSRLGKELTKNDTEFRMYNKFGAEATITYEPEAIPEDQLKEQPAKK